MTLLYYYYITLEIVNKFKTSRLFLFNFIKLIFKSVNAIIVKIHIRPFA